MSIRARDGVAKPRTFSSSSPKSRRRCGAISLGCAHSASAALLAAPLGAFAVGDRHRRLWAAQLGPFQFGEERAFVVAKFRQRFEPNSNRPLLRSRKKPCV